MADGGASKRTKAARSRQPGAAAGEVRGTLELTLDDLLDQPLPGNLPAEMFTGPGPLALADLLPVMTAYYDRDARIQFINKLFADWLDKPRPEIIGRTMAEVIGEQAWLDRKPMVEPRSPGSGSSSSPSQSSRRAGRSSPSPNMCLARVLAARSSASSRWSRT